MTRRYISGSIVFDSTGTERRRIQLFDGRFDTGYVIKRFVIAPDEPTIGQELTGKLTTDDANPPIKTWDWGDNVEIGWATWGTPIASRHSDFSHVRPDNMVIQDLYVELATVAYAGRMNYFIEMEYMSINEWEGALGLVRNSSQG